MAASEEALQILRRGMVEMITEVEMKPLLEENELIARLYDNGQISADDFYQELELMRDALEESIDEDN